MKREKRLILAHGFGEFSPWLVGPTAFGPVVAGKHDRAKHLGSKDREEKTSIPQCPLMALPTMT